ncbi:MAG TPA: hypothetical protein VJN88_04865 [Ktedonobacterales bacterium]|nr:hypothetical protein [Ktedonobacterales bacterium]
MDTQLTRRPRRHMGLVLALGAIFLGTLALAACGASVSPGITGRASATAGARSQYAYLYSRIDYPLQIPVNDGDTVSLILSPFSDILTVAPTAGTGSTTFSEPIPLPTDLQNYQDIGASVDTIAPDAASPLVWQLTSAPRQSLLTPPDSGQRDYLSEVTFKWQVRAVSAGENTTQIEMTLYYVYLDGSEHDGKVQVSQSPIPVVAVNVSGARQALPPLRLPIAGLTGLAGVLAFFRFFWGAYRTVKDVADTGRDAAKVAHTIQRKGGAVTGANTRGAEVRVSRAEPTAPPAVSPVSNEAASEKERATGVDRRKHGRRLLPPLH